MKLLKLDLPSASKKCENHTHGIVQKQGKTMQNSHAASTSVCEIHTPCIVQKQENSKPNPAVKSNMECVKFTHNLPAAISTECSPFQTLPENVRAEAKERLKFLQYIQQQKMPGIPHFIESLFSTCSGIRFVACLLQVILQNIADILFIVHYQYSECLGSVLHKIVFIRW